MDTMTLVELTASAARRVRSLVLIALLMGAGALGARAQEYFLADAVGVRAAEESEQTRVDLYTKIPYKHLHFIRRGDEFEARYQVTADVYLLSDENKPVRLAESRIWDRRVTTPSYDATRAKRLYDPTTQSVQLPPGNYVVRFQIEEPNVEGRYVREVPIHVRDLSSGVGVSDIILLQQYDEETNTISPKVGRQVDAESERFLLFYELYRGTRDRTVSVERTVHRLPPNSAPSVWEVVGTLREEEMAEPVYEQTDTRSLTRARAQSVVSVPTEEMGVGEYLVRVQVRDAQSGRLLDEAARLVEMRWSGLAQHIQSIQNAVAQLQYIAKQDEIAHIREAPTDEQKMARFRQFWKKRDPTPTTPRNERMEEYYYRVSFANERYGSLEDGWRTDRGQVLVLFGEPDFIESHPNNFSSDPYEIWYYYRMGKRFIFIDRTGFGRYQLLVPIWDERTRIR